MSSTVPSPTTSVSAAHNVLRLSQQLLGVFAQASSYREGWIRPLPNTQDRFQVKTIRSVRDVDENTARSYLELSQLSANGAELTFDRFPLARSLLSSAPKAVLSDISSSGKRSISFYNAALSKSSGGSDLSASFVEIDDEEFGTYRVDLSKSHGKVIGDAWFGGLSWSPDETYVVYVAQLKAVPKKTAIDSLTSLGQLEIEGEIGGDKFVPVEDWGEKYVDVSDLGLFIISLSDGSVKQLPMSLQDVTTGQPTFVSSNHGLHVAFTAWNNQPRKLGMIYCYQRKSTVFVTSGIDAWLSAEGNESITNSGKSVTIKEVSEGLELARSPRSAYHVPNVLLFLGNKKGFLSHNGCIALYRANIAGLFEEGKETSAWQDCVIDCVDVPEVKKAHESNIISLTTKELQFPGIFCDQLPRKCFLQDGRTVLVTSMWAEQETLLEVCLERKVLRRHSWHDQPFDEGGCFSILDIHNDFVLGVSSTPVSPFRLVAFKASKGTFDGFATLSQVPTMPISSKGSVPKAKKLLPTLSDWSFTTFQHEASDGILFGSFLLHPKKFDRRLPLILVPHGGPHSVTPSSFLASYLYLTTSLNACVLQVNYRGSTGYGQQSIDSLLGNIGTNDVADMMQALNHARTLYFDMDHNRLVAVGSDSAGNSGHHAKTNNENWIPVVDDTKVAVVGGSHGGFLGAHLSGQHGDVFKACCLRNPVTNIPSMVSVTDIPDWCHVESLPHASSLYPDICQPEELAQMHKVSPVAHLSTYKVPTLICLGAKDRRVPASQGVEFYHLLRKRNIPTRLLVFPEDVHAIDQPTSEAEHWIAIAHWIEQYFQ